MSNRPTRTRNKFIRKAKLQLEDIATGGKFSQDQYQHFVSAMRLEIRAQRWHGPREQKGSPCAGCGQPRGSNIWEHAGLEFCSPGCRDAWVLEHEIDKLYMDDPPDPDGARCNRALWTIAFRTLFEQDSFDFSYGSYENEVFLVRPYCWQDCECPEGMACTCEASLPNFVYKPIE